MMDLYAFELGRQKKLCTSELIAVLKEKNLVEKNIDTVIFSLPDQDFSKLQNQLGGTIKIMKIFHTFPTSTPSEQQMFEQIQDHLQNFFKDHSGKIPFSVSTLNYTQSQNLYIKKTLNFSKKFLKSLGLNSRFVNKNFKNTRPSTIFKAKVIQKGIDICLIKGNKNLYLGESITIQNIDEYSLRDSYKPKRDPQVGMTPPKLAQIMINLAENTQTIYDPFCGTGTFVMEGLLMGKNAIGSDMEPRMVEYSQENIKWLEKEFGVKNKWRVFEKDARFISKKDLPEKIEAIVTEGYLGQLFSHPPTEHEIEISFRELANLHFNWLRAANQVLEKGGKIVMCITAYKVKDKLIHLPRFDQIVKESGFKQLDFHTYSRPDQIVARDIAILEKV